MNPVLCPVVVGRDTELARLRAALDAVRTGRGGAVVLVGPPGSGKSRLVREVAEEGAGGREAALVLTGRAVASPVPVPFRPLTEALQGALRRADEPSDLGPYRSALGQVLPQWAEPDGRRGGAGSLVVLAEGVLRLLRELAAGRPTLLVLEDLHWADVETLAVLEYLADNCVDEPVLLLGTLREDGRDALAVVAALASRRRADVLRLPRLGRDDVLRLAAACLGREPDRELGEVLTARADGVPLFVEELLAVAVAAGAGSAATAVPHGFRESVRARLAELLPRERRVVECAAVLGRGVDWREVAAAAGEEPPVVLRALRAAEAAQLLAADDEGPAGGLQFRHALTRDAVLADVFGPERAALAAAALRGLRAADPELGGNACQRAADLAEEAGATDEAVELLVRAARRAAASGALVTAEALLDRARGLVSSDPSVRVAVDELLLEVLAAAARADRVFDVGRVLLARLDSTADPARVARCHLRLAQAALDAAELPRAHKHLAQSRAVAAALRDPELDLRVDLVAADAALVEQRLDVAEPIAERAAAAALQLGLPAARCEAQLLLGRCQRERDPDTAERTFASARDAAEAHGLPVLRVRAMAELGSLDMQDSRPPDRLLDAAAQAQAAGVMAVAGVALLHAAITRYLRHETEEALACADELAALAERFRLGLLASAARVLAACVHASRGDLERMEALLAEHLPRLAGDPTWLANCWGNARAVARLGEDDRLGASDALHRAAALGRTAVLGSNPHHSLGVLVDVVAGADDESHPMRADHAAARSCRGLLLAARAVTLGRHGQADAAVAAQSEALALLAPMPWYRHVAARLVAECALADGWGTPEAWLRETEAWAESAGLPRLADASRGLLRRAGVRVPRQASVADVPPPLRGLGVTNREAEVLHLVAEGASNRDIAARLFLSPRTVEKHVERLLQKTGAVSRTELAVRAVSLRDGR